MLSDTKDGLVRSSCQESRRSMPSFEFALQSITSMEELIREWTSGTRGFTYMGEYDTMWPFSGAIDPLIRTEAV